MGVDVYSGTRVFVAYQPRWIAKKIGTFPHIYPDFNQKFNLSYINSISRVSH